MERLHAAQDSVRRVHAEAVQFNAEREAKRGQNPVIASLTVGDRPRVRIAPAIDLPRYRLVLLRETDARLLFKARTAQSCILEWALAGQAAAALGYKPDQGDHHESE